MAGVPSRFTGIDLVIVRENTEDLYAGIEHYIDPRRTAAESIAIIHAVRSERDRLCVRVCAAPPPAQGDRGSTRPTSLKMSNGLFLDTGREVAKRYPDMSSRT